MSKQIRHFGTWASRLSAGIVAGGSVRLGAVQIFEEQLYWTEQRPEEKGRVSLMRQHIGRDRDQNTEKTPDIPLDVLPASFSCRSKVHEYGGTSFLVCREGLFFVNADDQDIWWLRPTLPPDTSPSPFGPPVRLTKAESWRFADLEIDTRRNRLIAVAEFHGDEQAHPQNELIHISLSEENAHYGKVEPLASGDDFYASPRLSCEGDQIAFLSWNLPHMPWEAARLHIAHMDKSGLITSRLTPTECLNSASFQPAWDQKGYLWFVNDRSGFGKLSCFDGRTVGSPDLPDAEFGSPLWVLGMKTFGFLADGRIVVAALEKAKTQFYLIDPDQKRVEKRSQPICRCEQLVVANTEFGGIFSEQTAPDAITLRNIDQQGSNIIRKSAAFDLRASEISTAQHLVFQNNAGQSVHGFYYAPKNNEFSAPPGELPPVIFTAHGGPTAFSDCGFSPKIQYWTSRGFGYFDVNYSGSWGFGNAYRERLDGSWGVLDVLDMEAAARHLIAEGLADPSRLLISGSSAGGYTVLMTLAKTEIFAAGASYYGIGDLARLKASTHKFEAGYLDRLLGLNADNEEQVLKERSPLHIARSIKAPVIFFQGGKDKVVPPEQAELMVQALQNQNIETQYKLFPEEGHGFRNYETIKTALSMEYAFYAEILAFAENTF